MLQMLQLMHRNHAFLCTLTRAVRAASDALENRPVRACAAHFPENPSWLVDQSFRRIKLKDLPVPQDQDTIVVENCLQAVCYGDDDRGGKFLADSLLDLRGT